MTATAITRCLRFTAVSGLLLLIAPVLSTQAQQPDSRFQRVVTALQEGPESERRLFARAALTLLAELYMAEADLARHEARKPGGPGDASRWAMAVDQFSAEVLQLSQGLESAGELGLTPGRGVAPVVVTVGGQRVMLSHPRASEQSAYEQAVLESFCAGGRCARLLPSVGQAGPIPVTRQTVKVDWAFSGEGLACAFDGVSLRFSAGGPVSQVRGLCEQFHQELASLQLEMRWQTGQQVPIDWRELRIERRANDPEHIVRLNRPGDILLLRLPLLASNAGLFNAVGPWLRRRVEGESDVVLAIDAADYGLGN
ncbi:hypothetical protein [Parahaliea mediterranea]|uniref:Uncharacterized protein n=1 Tax=Parahaliea mediterranea TaxID=651086 RepID=A0A939IKP5_9GAMM|nr:hypothetical protein [Parahaliea mediterranea]MBN7795660.1 hypothetical protein [Parahaliea mediterranea]